MQHRVPKFIEREPRIVGPLTFKQFIYLAGAGGICFLLYFSLAKTSFLLFLLATIILTAAGLALAFLNIGGKSLPELLENFFSFFIAPKLYLWKRKKVMPKVIKKAEPEKVKKEAPALKMIEKSRLKELSIEIETKT